MAKEQFEFHDSDGNIERGAVYEDPEAGYRHVLSESQLYGVRSIHERFTQPIYWERHTNYFRGKDSYTGQFIQTTDRTITEIKKRAGDVQLAFYLNTANRPGLPEASKIFQVQYGLDKRIADFRIYDWPQGSHTIPFINQTDNQNKFPHYDQESGFSIKPQLNECTWLRDVVDAEGVKGSILKFKKKGIVVVTDRGVKKIRYGASSSVGNGWIRVGKDSQGGQMAIQYQKIQRLPAELSRFFITIPTLLDPNYIEQLCKPDSDWSFLINQLKIYGSAFSKNELQASGIK